MEADYDKKLKEAQASTKIILMQIKRQMSDI